MLSKKLQSQLTLNQTTCFLSKIAKNALVTDSEKIQGRCEIIDSLHFQPIHSAHIIGFEITNYETSSMEGEYMVIICTGPLIFERYL